MTITIGIDVSKNFLDLYDSINQSHKRFANSDAGVAELLTIYQAAQCKIIVESTGIYQQRICYAATLQNMEVCVVNPLRVRQFARSSGQLAKSDKLDAKVLCSFGEKMDVRSVFPRSSTELKLADYLRLRQHLIAQRRACLNHLEAQSDEAIHTTMQPVIDSLDKQLKICEKDIRELLRRDEKLANKQALLLTAPGVGEVLSWHLLAFLPELGKVSREEIAALVGVAPMVCESGNYRAKAQITGGRSLVRKVLYMGILSSIRWSKHFEKRYLKLINKGKAAKLAIVACMRCLLICLNNMIKNQEAWREG
jgi:transposase